MSNALTDVFSGPPNLSTKERAISVVLGLGLAAAAAQPRPNKLLSLAVLLGGSLLAIRGATGHCAAKALLEQQPESGRLHYDT
ncbi:YgaP-like transmembrane domain [Methylobacterium oryzisoli]|uniref:YgaP-like transmembrane domain n=1 Tax=Methylobacterium oryzisoli TaxID=3385502 RepID=UPI003892B756